jgi:glutamate/tyrosine decarboxylase-like PLP-dependent enzyme
MATREPTWLNEDASLSLHELCEALLGELELVYSATRPIPAAVADPPPLSDLGLGMDALPDLWASIREDSSKLAAPQMMGHMDTAPHPAAALTDALVSALNNNLLFRELSPLASRLEELLLADFAGRFGLASGTPGLFCSGGSLANLTAIFAACGGFAGTAPRDRCRLFTGSAAHSSIAKAAAVLGLSGEQIQQVKSDDLGRIEPEALDQALAAAPDGNNIVAAVFGSTIHGALDDPLAISEICKRRGAWFHLDAVYGGALAFSHHHRARLKGVAAADSLAWGPQKWLYVPRLSAVLFIKDPEIFERTLAVDLPYSVSGAQHRGRWGLQGSRRADVLPLWVTLQVMGTRRLGEIIDAGIARAQRLHEILLNHPKAQPSHQPELNLQAFRWGAPDLSGERLAALHGALTAAGGPWVSLARWQGESLFRSVLLSPATEDADLDALLMALQRAETSLG